MDSSAEDRLQKLIQDLAERPRDTERLVTAGDLAEELGRKHEAWLYWHRAMREDASLRFLIERLKRVADGPEQEKAVAALEAQPATYRDALRGIWKYPITGPTCGTFWVGVIFFTAIHFFGVLVSAAALLGLLIVPYLMIFFIHITRATAFGSDDLPPWPDLRDLFRLFGAFFQFFGAWLAAFWPLMILSGSVATGIVGVLGMARALPLVPLAILGALYAPMALLANCIYDGATPAFRYVFLIRSIARTWRPYRLLVAWQIVCSFIAGVGVTLLGNETLFLMTGPALYFLELYGMSLQMRVIGLFYRYHKGDLAWDMSV